MSETAIDPRYLETFPQWLRSLGQDVIAVGDVARTAVASSGDGDDEVARCLVGAVNYVFKSLDLIPDGIDDLGFMDDAFVLRVACAQALDARPELKGGAIENLAQDAQAVRAFLGESYPRLDAYVRGLRRGAARGRTVDDVVGSGEVLAQFLREVRAWADSYTVPSFSRDTKTLVKLKAFLSAKLA